MNRENYKLVLDKIESDPNCWRQDIWHCGSKHCFAGWAQILSGGDPYSGRTWIDAQAFLDLSNGEAEYLFHDKRTREDFHEFLRRDEMNVTEKR